jgi:hypothetical protein
MLFVVAALAATGARAAPHESATVADTHALPTESSQKSETLQEVTVTANRISLEQRVSKFVYQIASLQNKEGIARWRVPVCPYVGGVSKEDAEYSSNRIVQIARTAGIPTSVKTCNPNLLIVVTADPKGFFSGMTNRSRILVFAGAHPSVVDGFIRAGGPVKVWYKTNVATPDGKILANSDQTETERGMFGPPRVSPETSYIKLSVIWGMGQVLVVVDKARLQSVALGQFADYVAMIGLSQIKVGAPLGDAPTILKLFDGAPHDAPEGISDWDLAFLKSLYSTESTSKGQRGAIAHRIVNDMDH